MILNRENQDAQKKIRSNDHENSFSGQVSRLKKFIAAVVSAVTADIMSASLSPTATTKARSIAQNMYHRSEVSAVIVCRWEKKDL